MKSQKIITIVLITLCVIVLVILGVGWRFFNQQKQQLAVINDTQSFIGKKVNRHEDRLGRVEVQAQANMRDVKDVEEQVENAQNRSQEIARALDAIEQTVETYQERVDELERVIGSEAGLFDDEFLQSEGETESETINLGEIAVHKAVTLSTSDSNE